VPVTAPVTQPVRSLSNATLQTDVGATCGDGDSCDGRHNAVGRAEHGSVLGCWTEGSCNVAAGAEGNTSDSAGKLA